MLKRLRPLDGLDVDGYYEGPGNKWEDEEPSSKQQKTTNHFLHFCDLILKYEKYPTKEESSKNSLYSPSASDRTNDSYSTESNSSFGSDPAANETEDENNDAESWDLITCHCMKPFAGRPMIECTKCQTWIHMSCAKIRRNNIPEDFVCQHCRDEQSRTRRSERIRGEDRRIVSA